MSIQDVIAQAQANQEEKQLAFLSTAVAFAGGKVKTAELLQSGKRFEKNVVRTDSMAIMASSAGADKVLTYTNKEDRAILVGDFGFLIDSEGVSIPDGVIDQLNRLVACEVKRASGSHHEVSFASHFHGTNAATPGGYTDDDRFADRMEPLNIPEDFANPLDYLNPGETIKFSLTGLTGVTPAESYAGTVNIVAHLSTMDFVKG